MKATALIGIPITLGIIAAGMTWEQSPDASEFSEKSTHIRSSANSKIFRTSKKSSQFPNERHTDRPSVRTSPIREDFSLTLNPSAPTNAQENLAQLQQHSTQRLASLGQSLNLTPHQRRQAYPLLVRSSPLFNSDVEIGGELTYPLSSNEAQGALFDLLDEEQQNELIEDLLAEKEWWDELLVDLENELDEDLAQTEAPPIESIPIQESETQKSFNLFDSLGQ